MEAHLGLKEEPGISLVVSVNAAGDGCGPPSKISYLLFEEVVALLIAQEPHGTRCVSYSTRCSS
jgi:hypothetical protein